MSLLSLIAVLLLEQLRPLPYRRLVQRPLARLAHFLENAFNAGERSHGVIAWLAGAGGLALVALLIFVGLYAINPLLAWIWNVAVLYLTMGFRQFSHHFSDIESALRRGDLAQARTLLAQWRGRSAADLGSSEIARLAIEQALVAAHRHVFGVLVCFVLLPGPSGAVLYRVAAFLAEEWGKAREGELGDFGSFARQAFTLIDWLPSRMTAAGFAIVGNFEDAIYCWRTQAAQWRAEPLASGIVLASAAGALGVRLGMPVYESGGVADRVEIGVGEDADVEFMQSAVALVWRALVLWLLLLLLLGLAGLIGG
jgi:cobalamin biosynthesis protein CobD/CbiB